MEKTEILVVDGDTTSSREMADWFGETYEVLWASTEAEGLDLARTTRPALMLVNHALPSSSGFDFLEHLKQNPRLRDIPIIFVFDQKEVEQEALALDLGVADTITKPYHPRLLARRVSNVVSREMLRTELGRREAEWRAMLNAVPDLMFRLDRRGTYLSVFARNPELLKRPKRQLLSRNVKDVLPPEAAEMTLAAIAEAAESGASYGREIELRLPDGNHWFELSMARADVGQEAEPTFILLSRDITLRKRAELEITRLARQDALTGLPNRGYFIELSERSLAMAQRCNVGLALLYIDLDKFKPINDTHGHQTGDLVLKEAALRMRSGLRSSDTVGSMGGDEFMILLTDVESAESAFQVAEKVRGRLEEPILVDGKSLDLSCSVGIALYPDHAPTFQGLSHCADLAMYAAKREGRNAVKVFEAETSEP